MTKTYKIEFTYEELMALADIIVRGYTDRPDNTVIGAHRKILDARGKGETKK